MRIAFDKQTAAISCQTITWLFLLFQILILAVWGYTPTNDGLGYRDMALECCRRGELYPNEFFFHYDELPFVWNIGIINLTALSFWLTGTLTPLLLTLIALKTLTAYALSRSVALLFGDRMALVALVLYVVYPNNWGQATMISSEIPSDCLSVVAVWLLLKGLRTDGRQWCWLLSAGLLLGLANWFRPTAAIYLTAIALYVVVAEGWRRACRLMLPLAAGFALLVATVGTSSYLRTGHFLYQSRSYWFAMVDECYDGAAVAPHWGQPIWPKGYPRYVEGHEQMDCFELEAIWKERSLTWLRDHKLEYLSKLPGRLYYLYQTDYDNLTVFLPDKQRAENNYIVLPYRSLLSQASTLTGTQWMAFATMVLYALVLLLATVGTVRLLSDRRDRRRRLLPLLIVMVGTAMLIVVTHTETRFKSPLMPWIFALAAVGLWPVIEAGRRHQPFGRRKGRKRYGRSS